MKIFKPDFINAGGASGFRTAGAEPLKVPAGPDDTVFSPLVLLRILALELNRRVDLTPTSQSPLPRASSAPRWISVGVWISGKYIVDKW